jgi:hypothetical protein
MSGAELLAPAAPSSIPTAAELIVRARVSKLRERAVKAGRDRNIPQELIDEFIAARLIHALQPKRLGRLRV